MVTAAIFRNLVTFPVRGCRRYHPCRSLAEIVSRIPNGCFCLLTLLLVPQLLADVPAAAGVRDTLVFANGDTLQGRLDREVSGTVFFHSDELGDISVPWAKIKSLHTQAGYVVLENKPGVRLRHLVIDASHGTLAVTDGHIEVSPGTAPPPIAPGAPGKQKQRAVGAKVVVPSQEPIPVGNAQFILDEQTFDRQVRREPNLFTGVERQRHGRHHAGAGDGKPVRLHLRNRAGAYRADGQLAGCAQPHYR